MLPIPMEGQFGPSAAGTTPHRPTPAFLQPHSNLRRTPRSTRNTRASVAGQANTCKPQGQFRSSPLRHLNPALPTCPFSSRPFPAITPHSAPLRCDSPGKTAPGNLRFAFRISDPPSAAPDRMRGGAAASPSGEAFVLAGLSEIFQSVLVGVASAPSVGGGGGTAAVASGSASSRFSAQGSLLLDLEDFGFLILLVWIWFLVSGSRICRVAE